jgi:hypothetical protein
VVRRLDEEVEWALTSNPTGPAEIVGILLGQSGRPIQIRDCQPVFLLREGDHEYALTGPGRREFERKMAEFRWTPERSVVGFYRSHIGDGLELSEEDLGLLRTCFRDTSQVVLLMKLTGGRSCSAKLFLGNEGQVFSEFESSDDETGLPRWLELWQHLSTNVPMDRSAAKETTTPADTTTPSYTPPPRYATTPAYSVTPADVATPAPTAPPVPTAPPASTAPSARTEPVAQVIPPNETPSPAIQYVRQRPVAWDRRLKRRRTFILAAVSIVALLVGYFMLKASARLKQGATTRGGAATMQPDSSRQSDIALRADRDGDDVRLNWNRKAPALVAATGGMLTIREANGPEKQVVLDADLLRRGGIVYRPLHGDVFFRLAIFGQGGVNMGESVTTFPNRTSVSNSDSNKERK